MVVWLSLFCVRLTIWEPSGVCDALDESQLAVSVTLERHIQDASGCVPAEAR